MSGVIANKVYYTLGPSLSLPLPLFDWNRAGVEKARLSLRQAELLLAGLLVDVTQEARAAHARVVTTVDVARSY